MWPPSSVAPSGSITERTPARLWSNHSSCTAGGASGKVTTACRLRTSAPQAHRSLQACRVVRRALSQGSSRSAGKPSTLCSSSSPRSFTSRRAASSAGGASPEDDSRPRAPVKGAAGSLAAHPRQAIGADPAAIAAAGAKPCVKRRSIRSFQRHKARDGPQQNGPYTASARGDGGPCAPPSPSSCRAQRCGRQRRSGNGGSACKRRRFSANTGAARTAHTPAGGLGSVAITEQSPLANSRSHPCTTSLASVSTRPVPTCTGKPLAASQAGARLPVQARSAAA